MQTFGLQKLKNKYDMTLYIPKKVEHWVYKELDYVKSNLVLKNNDSEYEVFGKFRIVCKMGEAKVYQQTNLIGKFSSKRIAIAWCTAKKFNLVDLSAQIKITDQRLSALKDDIKVRSSLAANGKRAHFRDNLNCKLINKISRQKQLERCLEKCVNLAKYYQQRGFNNGTPRLV